MATLKTPRTMLWSNPEVFQASHDVVHKLYTRIMHSLTSSALSRMRASSVLSGQCVRSRRGKGWGITGLEYLYIVIALHADEKREKDTQEVAVDRFCFLVRA